MKLSANTVKILQNFSTINPGMVFEEGNVQHTISPLNSIVCQATLTENFSQSFAIYDLESLLKLYKAFSDAEIVLNEDHLLIKNDKESMKFYYADPQMIVVPKKKPYDHDTTFIRFPISNDILLKIKSITGISTFFKHLKIWLRGNDIILSLTNKESKDRAINQYDVVVGNIQEEEIDPFEFFLQVETLKILDGDYEFVISSIERPDNTLLYILRLVNTTYNVKYWTALES